VSFNDSDWTLEAEEARARRHPPMAARVAGAWGLAAGIVIGAAAATLVLYASGRLDRAAPSSLDARPGPMVSKAAPSPPPPPQPEQHAAVPPRADEPMPATPEPTRAEPAMPAPPTASPAPKPSNEELRRKERAWARWYQRPTICDGNPTTDQLIECANHFIRSKREFEERWRAGML
jgi:type IV secretory pathway VirB10-like protein